MSSPTRRVRQPGRTAQGHNPPDCGVCNNGAPTGIALQVSGLDTCCFPDLDNAEGWQLTPDAGNCDRSKTDEPSCFYSTIDQQGLGNFEFSATLSCVPDGAGFRVQWDVKIAVVDVNGAELQTLATGQWQSDLLDSCGDYDCTFPGDPPGGTWTVASTGYCSPGSCSSPTWGLTTGNVDPCPQSASLNCCCGGTPPPPCWHACVTDVAGGCSPDGVDVRMCPTAENPLSYSGSGTDADGNTATATLTYDPTGPSYTLVYTCNGGSPQTQTFTPASGWSKVGGAINLSWEDGSGSSLSAGRSPQCPIMPPCDCCTTSGIPTDIDVNLGAGGWTTPAGGDSGSCENIKGAYTVTSDGGAGFSSCWSWSFTDDTYSGYCFFRDWQLAILVELFDTPCHWRVTIFFHGTATPSLTTAVYESADLGSTGDCYSGAAVSLSKISETGTVGACGGNTTCNGTLPETITLTAVV